MRALLSRSFRARPSDEHSLTCEHKLGGKFPSSKNSHCQVNAKCKTYFLKIFMEIKTHCNKFLTPPIDLKQTRASKGCLRKGLFRIGLDHMKQGYFRSLTFDYSILDDCKQYLNSHSCYFDVFFFKECVWKNEGFG